MPFNQSLGHILLKSLHWSIKTTINKFKWFKRLEYFFLQFISKNPITFRPFYVAINTVAKFMTL
jgi:hypothetical protein